MDRRAVAEALPSYEIDRPLGRGAMGEVLGGTHRDLGRAVAIKGLPAGFAADQAVRERFGAEARTLASLSHPHVVPVYDYVERDGLCLLVMEALPGGTLWDRFCEDGVSMPVAAAVALACCAGLQHAHERKVIHRDIKPENLMFDGERTLKVTDFGIAALLGDGALATADGEVIGTPAYMAPEQADGSPVTPAADVYAVATVLYELLSGRLPFDESGDAMDLLRRRLDVDPTPLLDVAPQVPPALAEATMAGLARDAAARPPSAEAFGISVASAAAAAWGPHWLERSDVQLLVGGTLASAASAAPASAPATAGAGDAEVAASAPGRAAATVAPGAAPEADRSRAAETVVPGAPSVPEPSATADPVHEATVVRRPTRVAERSAGPDLSDLRPADVVPLARAVQRRRVSWVALVGAVVAFASALLVGLSAPSDPTTDPSPPGLAVGGQLVTESPVAVDLSDPISVVVADPPAGATQAQLRFSAGAIPMGSSNTEPLRAGERGAATELSATSTRLLSSGPVEAELVLTDEAGTEVQARTFGLDPDRPAFLTVGGLLALLVGVGSCAYGWAATAPLRRGRRRVGAFVTLAVCGAFAGWASVLWGWSIGAGVPSLADTVAPSALAAIAFVLAGAFVLSVGRARRSRRRRRSAAVG